MTKLPLQDPPKTPLDLVLLQIAVRRAARDAEKQVHGLDEAQRVDQATMNIWFGPLPHSHAEVY